MSASDLGNKDLLWGCCLATFWGQFCSCAFKHCPFSCAQTEVNSCPPPQVNILTAPAAHLGTGSTGLECHLPASSRQRGLLPAPGTDTAPSAPEPLHCPQRCFSFPWPHLLQGLLQRGQWNDTVSLHLGQTAGTAPGRLVLGPGETRTTAAPTIGHFPRSQQCVLSQISILKKQAQQSPLMIHSKPPQRFSRTFRKEKA